MTKEAQVFVRFGVPWVTTLCPECNDRVNPEDKFCSHCGQALSFDLYRAVLKGTLKPKRTTKWTEVVPDTEATRKSLEQALIDLEKKYCVPERNEPILRIMREQYIKSVFGE